MGDRGQGQCPSCGTAHADGARFCARCGALLEAPRPSKAGADVGHAGRGREPAFGDADEGVRVDDGDAPGRGGPGRGPRLAAAAALVLLVAAVGGLLAIGGLGSDDPTEAVDDADVALPEEDGVDGPTEEEQQAAQAAGPAVECEALEDCERWRASIEDVTPSPSGPSRLVPMDDDAVAVLGDHKVALIRDGRRAWSQQAVHDDERLRRGRAVGEQLLLSTTEGSLILVSGDGERLWTRAGWAGEDQAGPQVVGAWRRGDHVVIHDIERTTSPPSRMRVTAIDPESGEIAWRREAGNASVGSDLALLVTDGALEAVSLADGETRWRRDGGELVEDAPLGFAQQAGEHVFALGSGIEEVATVVLDADSGETLATHPGRPVVAGERVLIDQSARQVARADSADDADAAPGSDVPYLLGLDPEGAVSWRRPLVGSGEGEVAVRGAPDGSAYITGPRESSAVQVVDPVDGSLQHRAPLALHGASWSPLPSDAVQLDQGGRGTVTEVRGIVAGELRARLRGPVVGGFRTWPGPATSTLFVIDGNEVVAVSTTREE